MRGEHDPFTRGVHETGGRHADAEDLGTGRDLVDGLGERVLHVALVHASSRRRATGGPHHAAEVVHDPRENLGSPDVHADPDLFSHGPSLAYDDQHSGMT